MFARSGVFSPWIRTCYRGSPLPGLGGPGGVQRECGWHQAHPGWCCSLEPSTSSPFCSRTAPKPPQALHGRSALAALEEARMSQWLWLLPELRALAPKPHHSPATCEPFPRCGQCQQGWFIPTICLWINTSRQASICCSVAPCSGCGTGFYHKSSSSHKKAEARD